MRIVGVDPGMTGAFALVCDGDLLEVVDMPTIDGHVNGALVYDVLQDMRPTVVVMERTQPMPTNGSIGNFKLGLNTGVVRGVVSTMEIPLVSVSPSVWKRSMGFNGQDKDATRRMAVELWPCQRESFSRKKDHGRADAAMIALNHWRKGS